MPERALSFGPVAEAYEEFRPGYPVELVDLVLSYAGTPVRTALEIGAGTGKATRLFARHGITVTATDPDAAMLAVLRKHVPPTVSTIQSPFEDLPQNDCYDLVYAAAALHWTNPQGRWPHIAALLEPGGVFASFGGPIELADPVLRAAVSAVRAPHLPTDDIPSPDGTPPHHDMQWPGTELLKSPQFIDVRQYVLERRLTMNADAYLGHLATISAYLTLPPVQRQHLFTGIRQALPPTVDITADITAHLARRRPGK